jgi:hypothetical protein
MSEVSGVPLSGNCTFANNTGAISENERGGFAFCSLASHDCNGGNITPLRLLQPPPWLGGSISPLYNACNDANGSAGTRIGAFVGRTNWRVPNLAELTGIVDFSGVTAGAKINGNFFPNTSAVAYNTTDIQTASVHFIVNFSNGDFGSGNKGTTYSVRCVPGP